MKRLVTIRIRGFVAGLIMAGSADLRAQLLAPTEPTRAAAPVNAELGIPFTGAPAPVPSARPITPAKVVFENGNLVVTANNSSLNQILRAISLQNGMKITGGIAEERVFGTYGPKRTSAVLNDLLDGTKTNVLVLEDAHHVVRELVLTPRTGGATPPSPGAVANAESEDANVPPQPGERRRGGYQYPQNAPEPAAFAPPPQTQPSSETPNADAPNTEAPTAEPQTSPDATTEQSPNGVKTPQQIYDQLMKMQQPQQDPNAPTQPE